MRYDCHGEEKQIGVTLQLANGVVIAIPAKNEAERLGACLTALGTQVDAPAFHVLILLNNCTDGSERLVRSFERRPHFSVSAVSRELAANVASAGVARSMAMSLGAQWLRPDGVMMTTDADSRVAPDWVAANLAALARADAVAGRAVIDPEEAQLIPAKLHEDDARECAYAALLDEIASLIDPDPCDPWPRHDEHSGASIAVHAAIYRRAGGMPAIPLGEDRAFFTALRRIDARVRHAPEVWATVSGRTVGRAKGGMADTMLRRMRTPDPMLDGRLEAADRVVLRARLRRVGRSVYMGASEPKTLARAMGLPLENVIETLRSPLSFGAGWELLEGCCPLLARSLVPAIRLDAETARAAAILQALRAAPLSLGPADPIDTADDAFPNPASERESSPA